MPLRRRPRAADPLLEERVGRLLVPPAAASVPVGGWVPPADDDWPEPEPEPEPESAPEPVSAPWSAPEVASLPASASAPVLAPWSAPVLASVPAGERSWAPEPGGPASQPGSQPRSRPGLLPATLAGGRLDPGHRGAVALLLVCVLAALVASAVVLRGRPQEVAVPAVESAGSVLPGLPEPSPTSSPAPSEVVVAVVGEVAAPGVVRLPSGSRVDDAVRAAGGLAPGGSVGLLNLARVLQDGEQVVVGADAPPDPPAGSAPAAAGTSGGPVDLNRATVAELDGLPGIGPVLAERIVAWRTEHGGFASVDQLREVPGIGEAKFATLEPEVRVG